MTASILSLSTAVPTTCLTQEAVAETMIDILGIDPTEIHKLYRQSSIDKRYTVLSDIRKLIGMGSAERNEIYLEEAPKLAHRVAEKALQEWGGDQSAITHVVSVSCTGVVTPGIEYLLIDKLGLNRDVGRLAINMMGCFGAFKGLSVAQALAKEDPSHRVLVVCTELCTLHMQTDLEPDTLVGNALFADGAAAMVVGCAEGLWEILKLKSFAMADTLDQMSWNGGNTGMTLRLSRHVPSLIYQHIEPFVRGLADDYGAYDWAVHPGGKAIIKAVEKRLGLTKEQTAASWRVLANYGNMSSPTVLFILEELRQMGQAEHCVALSFGPGLSVEGALLQRR